MTRVHELRERWDLIKPRGGLRTLLPTLDRAATIDDLRRLAKLRTPRPVFDYVDGAAEAERSMLRNEGSFADVVFRPHVLRDVSSVDPTWTVLGSPSALPFGFAPTGFTRMMHTDGELAVGRVAASLGIPYGLSTVGTTTPEELAAELPHLRRWFQLYVWRDRGPTRAFVERAREAGFEALILTVDVPVAGARMRDVRNGLTLPPTPSLRTFLQGALHPAWSRDFLTKPPVRFASLETGFEGTAGSFIDRMFDPTVTFDDIEWVRSLWSGKIVVKGVQRIDDAERLAAIGVDAIVVSNHGAPARSNPRAPRAPTHRPRASRWPGGGMGRRRRTRRIRCRGRDRPGSTVRARRAGLPLWPHGRGRARRRGRRAHPRRRRHAHHGTPRHPLLRRARVRHGRTLAGGGSRSRGGDGLHTTAGSSISSHHGIAQRDEPDPCGIRLSLADDRPTARAHRPSSAAGVSPHGRRVRTRRLATRGA